MKTYIKLSTTIKYWLMNFLLLTGMLKNVTVENSQLKSFKLIDKMKKLFSIFFFVMMGFVQCGFGQTQNFTSGNALSASKWSLVNAASCTVGNNALTATSTAVFCTANGTCTGGSCTLAGINATENLTLSGPAGTISNNGNAVITITVANGKIADFLNQAFTSSATAGYNKNGAGELGMAGGTYGGGFTLNNGTICLRGANAMGSGGTLTINGGTISTSANANRDLTGKYTGGITIGGDFTLGSVAGLSTGGGNITFSNNMALGSVVRTITLGSQGTMILGGIISNSTSTGLTLTKDVNGTGLFSITNTANTFSGTLTIAGGVEARFSDPGSFGNANSTILIDASTLSNPNSTSYTIASTHSIQVGAGGNTIIAPGTSSTITYGGAIVDKPSTTGALKVSGGNAASLVVLTGASTYTGTTRVFGGTLQLNKTGGGTLPSAANVIVNGATATLQISKNQTLNDLTLTNGAITIDPGVTLTIDGTLTYTAGTITNNGSLIISSTGSMVGNANTMTGAGTVTINGSFSTTNANGFNGASNTAISSSITSITLGSASTIDYASASSQTITAFNYVNLTNSGNGARVLASSGTIGISGVSTSFGTGLYTVTGSTVNISVAANITAFPVLNVSSGPNYNNLIISGAAVYTMTSNMTVGGDMTINNTGGNFRVSNAATRTLTINGSLDVQAGQFSGTGSGVNAGTASTLSVGGDYIQSGGVVNLNNGTTTASFTATITGTFGLTGGTFNLISNANTSAGGNATVTVGGAVTVNVTGTDGIYFESDAAGSDNGVAIFQTNGSASFQGNSSRLVDFGGGTVVGNEFRIKGNFTKSGTGTFYTASSNSAGATGFVFNGTGTIGSPQTFSYTGAASDYTSYQVNSGTVVQMTTGVVMSALTIPYSVFTVLGTLDCGLSVISGGISNNNVNNLGFTLGLGATLMTKNTGGVLGSITHLKRNFNAGANYVFNGTVASQNSAFNANPQQMANLTINNSNGVTLTGSATVTGTLAFTAGKITTGAFTVTMSTSNAITGAGTSSYVNGNLSWILPGGASSRKFEVGNGVYAPVTLATNGAAVNTTINAKAVLGAVPTEASGCVGGNCSGINQSAKCNHYWEITRSAGSFTDYTALFNLTNTTNSGSVGGAITSYKIRKYDASPSPAWVDASTAPAGLTIQTSTLTTMSDFEIGTANTVTAGSNPSNADACTDGFATFTTSASASLPTPAIQWQEKIGAGAFTDITDGTFGGVTYAGATTTSLTITNPTLGMSTNQYRADFRNINTPPAVTTTAATLTVTALPTGAITSPDVTICSGGSTNITGTVTASTAWNLYLSDDLINPATSGIAGTNVPWSVSKSAAATYTIVLIELTASPSCESDGGLTGSTTVTVVPAPVGPVIAKTPSDAAVCTGEILSMTVTTPGSGGTGSPQDEYRYNDGTGFSGWSTSIPSFSAGVGTNTIESRRTASGSGCTTASGNSVSWTVAAQPVAPVIAKNPNTAAACSGQLLSISVTTPGTGGIVGFSQDEYRYNDGTGFSGWSTSIPNFAATTAGTNIIESRRTSTGSNCSTSSSNSVSWTVNPLPAATLSGSSAGCNNGTQNATVTLNFTAGSAPWSYDLYDGTNHVTGSTSVVNASIIINVTGYAAGTHTFSVFSLSDNNTCSGSGSGTATVIVAGAVPNNAITGVTVPAFACNGDQDILVTAGTLAVPVGSYYSWGTGSNSSVVKYSLNIGGPYLSTINTPTPQVYVQFGVLGTGSTGYNICVQAANGCGSSNNKCSWVQGSISTPAAIAGSTVVCSASSSNYSCSTVNPPSAIYTWSFSVPGATFQNQGQANVGTVTFPAFTTGQLCVTAKLSCTGAVASPARCITISNSTAPVGTMTGSNRVCPGATGEVYTVPVVTGATYNWTVPPGASITSPAVPSTSNTITVSFPDPYTSSGYSVCVTATSICAVTTLNRCVTVLSKTPGTPATITGSPLTGLCNQQVNFTSSIPSGVFTGYSWGGTVLSPTPAAGISNIVINGNNIVFDVAAPFTGGTLTVTADNNTCSPTTSSAPRIISISSAPAKPTGVTPTSVCNQVGWPVSFSAGSPAPLGTNYIWYFSGGTITGSNITTGSNPVTGTWNGVAGNVQVTASNGCGNSGTNVQAIAVTGTCRAAGTGIAASSFSAYPNPAHDNITLSITAKEQSNYTVKLMDLAGRVVVTESIQAIAGSNDYQMDLTTLPKGVYMLQVQSVNDNWNTRVVVE